MAGEMQRNADVTVGAEVYTRDDDKIGSVKEIRGGFFKVDAKMQADHWLQSQFVERYDAERVTMTFDKDNLGDYKVDEPGDYVTTVTDDAMESDGPGRHDENIASATIDGAERRAV